MTIAALFVEDGGAYFGVNGIDPWPAALDARNYPGPYPVIAHPPCEKWGAMAKVNFVRWGGEHNQPGNDGGCFSFALDAVRRHGGVLEHPAKTRAWAEFGIPKPSSIGWQRVFDGWVCEVWQSAYGHLANKATWLFYVGSLPNQLRWERPIGTYQIGFTDQRGKARNKPTLSRKMSRVTPTAFRDELIQLVKNININ